MKLKPSVVETIAIIVMVAIVISALLILGFKSNNTTSFSTYHINFCNDKEPGKIYVWENYQYQDKKLDEFQSNNKVEIIAVTEDDDIFSYHVKCLGQ